MQHRRCFSSRRCSLLRHCYPPAILLILRKHPVATERLSRLLSGWTMAVSVLLRDATPERNVFTDCFFFNYYFHFSLLTRPYLSIINAISIVRGCDNQLSTRFALKNRSKTNSAIKSVLFSEVAIKTSRLGADNVRTRRQ